jgi:hypothetical protein
MRRITVTTQAELDKLPEEGVIAELRGDGEFVVSGKRQITASGQVTIRAYGQVTITAYGQVTITASGQVTIRAYGQVTIRAYGQVTITASGQVTIRAYGQVTITAFTSYVTVRKAGSANAVTIEGPATVVVGPTNAEEWCAWYGVVPDGDLVTLFKVVGPDWKSGHGTSYEPGTTPEAPDWDPGPECGSGLHFAPAPGLAVRWSSWNWADQRFVACPVRLDEIVVHPDGQMPDKVKAPRVAAPCWEVDIDGDRITT